MMLLPALLLFFCLSQRFDLFGYVYPITNFAQSVCESWAPEEIRDIHQALVCGSNGMSQSTRQLMSQTGLIHLIVVSGSYLIVIVHILCCLRIPKWLQFLVLAVFTLMTGFQPPCVRALIALILRNWMHRWGWSQVDLQFRSTLLCWILVPSWLSSLSLQLSSVASLCLASSSSRESILMLQMRIALLLSPILAGQTLHPISWLCNLLFGAVLSVILFPLSLLSFVWDSGLFAVFWNGLKHILTAFAALGTHTQIMPLGWWGSIYVFAVFLSISFAKPLKLLRLNTVSTTQPTGARWKHFIAFNFVIALVPQKIRPAENFDLTWNKSKNAKVQMTASGCRLINLTHLPQQAPPIVRRQCANKPFQVVITRYHYQLLSQLLKPSRSRASSSQKNAKTISCLDIYFSAKISPQLTQRFLRARTIFPECRQKKAPTDKGRG